MLCGMAVVLQASGFDGVAFDPFSFRQDGLAAPQNVLHWRPVENPSNPRKMTSSTYAALPTKTPRLSNSVRLELDYDRRGVFRSKDVFKILAAR